MLVLILFSDGRFVFALPAVLIQSLCGRGLASNLFPLPAVLFGPFFGGKLALALLTALVSRMAGASLCFACRLRLVGLFFGGRVALFTLFGYRLLGHFF